MNKKTYLITFATIFLSLVFVSTNAAHGELITGWDIAGVDVNDDYGPPPFRFDATVSHANASGQLTLGAGVNPSTTANQYGFKVSGANSQNSLAGAIANDHFLQFAISVDSGYEMDLSSLKIRGQSSNTGSSDIVLMTSVDGFTDGDEIASVSGKNGMTGGFDTDSSGFGDLIDLTGGQYQGLTGTITFRIYGYGSTSGAGITYLRNLTQGGAEDLVLDGEISALTAVPEPSSMAVLSLFCLGAVRRFRKKRKANEQPAS